MDKINSILIYGSEGSMGRRYQAILKYLNVKFDVFDTKIHKKAPEIRQFDGIILCTPTCTHKFLIEDLQKFDKPILCDKPIYKDSKVVDQLMGSCRDLDIMFQYKEISYPATPNMEKYSSYYDYFRTGSDGLYWDCMQTIALHIGSFNDLLIKNESPIWKCSINNFKVYFSLMDIAYIEYLKRWINGKRTLKEEIVNYHQKVEAYIDHMKVKDEKHIDRNPS